ncbi:hypothetical protein FB45DRAFT_1006763 [Roridomyces roridus]|uniref:Uncharacterized protein n=1 Tax=Roridomyces roridus TaxID=1738132 RepID=A0AAD7BGP5_9AGAR|nr:hypothetical protein FB45DRAFT_1006763 [Roridomyces roridus]
MALASWGTKSKFDYEESTHKVSSQWSENWELQREKKNELMGAVKVKFGTAQFGKNENLAITDQKICCYQQTYTRSTHDKSLERDVARPSKEDSSRAVTRTIGQQYLSSAGRVARTEPDAPC